MIEVTKISAKGQVTIPIEFRQALGLTEGDKVAFIKGDDGNIYIFNASKIALKIAQKEFEGEANKAGLKNEDDVVALIRNERNGK